MNRKTLGVTLLAVAFASSAAWATGWHRGDDRDRNRDRDRDRDRHHHHDKDHSSRAWEKNPIFKKLFGGGTPPTEEPAPQPSDPGTGSPGPSVVLYDYRNYVEASNITAKTFSTAGTSSFAICGDTEARTYTRQEEAEGTRVTETRVRSKAGSNCLFERFEYLATDATYSWHRLDRFDNNGGSLMFTRVLTNPLPVYRSAMSMAGSWGSGSAIDNGTGVGLTGQVVETSALLGVENVEVPYGTFTNCLTIQHTRMSNQVGQFSAISWVCPGIGEVKRIEGQTGMMTHWLLTQVDAAP